VSRSGIGEILQGQARLLPLRLPVHGAPAPLRGEGRGEQRLAQGAAPHLLGPRTSSPTHPLNLSQAQSQDATTFTFVLATDGAVAEDELQDWDNTDCSGMEADQLLLYVRPAVLDYVRAVRLNGREVDFASRSDGHKSWVQVGGPAWPGLAWPGHMPRLGQQAAAPAGPAGRGAFGLQCYCAACATSLDRPAGQQLIGQGAADLAMARSRATSLSPKLQALPDLPLGLCPLFPAGG
jgi:hypothetical protein